MGMPSPETSFKTWGLIYKKFTWEFSQGSLEEFYHLKFGLVWGYKQEFSLI